MGKITCKVKTVQEEYIKTILLFWFFINLLFSYNIKIKLNKYVKLKLLKMNL